MIAFACSQCGMKFQVKDEFAGRRTKCPTCKQALTVPVPVATPVQPPARIDGPPSSLHQAGLVGGVTLSKTNTTGPAGPERLTQARPADGQRYQVHGEIARGGMGAVLRAVDCDIRREVAVKYLLDPNDSRKKARFVEEAQITGQLEHPNIVPIHELGVDAQKRLFFSMKLVKGRSLAQVFDELRKNPTTAGKEWSRGRLLTIFVNICHALAYAHSRGVVHRDLKPANIMLGDFGEVYVMDWGLAKVLGQPAPYWQPESGAARRSPDSLSEVSGERVQTDRDEADLTQEGAIVGTPAYMPPEQARGELAAIDERSDVYALGALLYEILTLQPPVEKQGGAMAILMRVAEGQIVPPEQRAPERARAGLISKELAAIALKALAKEPADRYADVDRLRRDVELFQEGRSVSAKQDTAWETFRKLVRRNKGVSATLGALVPLLIGVLLWSAWTNYHARKATTQAYQDYRDQVAKSVPAFVKAAHLEMEQRQFDDALSQAEVALATAPDEPDARLLKAQLLILRQDFAGAAENLEQYLKLRPTDSRAGRLQELCRQANPDDVDQLLRFAAVFNEQGCHALVDGLLRPYGKDSNEARQFLLKMYREKIEKAWPGRGKSLTIDVSGLRLRLYNFGELTDLSPLKGMPLTALDLGYCKNVADLSPLQGMPLTWLNCGGNVNNRLKIKDLAPLRGMPLTWLSLNYCDQVADLSPLQDLPLQSLDLTYLVEVRDLTPLRNMPLTDLILTSCRQVADLSPLQGKPLSTLNMAGCVAVRDLAPLRDMPLTSLFLSNCPLVADLSPLQGKSFTTLDLSFCVQVADLAPLRDLPLSSLILHNCTQVADLEPLRDLPLTSLNCNGTLVADLSPLRDLPLTTLSCCRTRVTDLSPLAGMKLRTLILTPKSITRGMDTVRDMKTLTSIKLENGTSFSPEEFCKKYEAGEFNK